LAVGCAALAAMLVSSRRREADATARREAAEDELKANIVNVASLSAYNQTLREQALRDREELDKIQASFRLEFRNLANEILEEKSKQFKATNREAMDVILKPFRDSIGDFRERVEKIYSDENQQRGALRNEIKNLQELNRRITEETSNLTSALKGNSKVQGDWGEMILETILESSNLEKGIHYTTQESLRNAEGEQQRPDVILRLPEGKRVIIDSKVSLTSYVNYCEVDSEEERKKHIADHGRSMRKHVEELGSKRYQELVESPDFVIMFVPNEPAFLAALQNDSSIWNDAYRRKVIISSPTNLFALLKIVDDLWKRDDQSRNALEIAEQGARLYDKFVGFVETLEAVGKGIGSASASYDKAVKQLVDGPGNLVGRTERLRKLGVKASKTLSAKMLADAQLSDNGDLDELPEGDE
jgi:DNA recombination protein RmuC